MKNNGRGRRKERGKGPGQAGFSLVETIAGLAVLLAVVTGFLMAAASSGHMLAGEYGSYRRSFYQFEQTQRREGEATGGQLEILFVPESGDREASEIFEEYQAFGGPGREETGMRYYEHEE